jgi:hypothetical protein
MVEVSDIAYCNKSCQNRNKDGTCKVHGTDIPEDVARGVYCPEWLFDGEEP